MSKKNLSILIAVFILLAGLVITQALAAGSPTQPPKALTNNPRQPSMEVDSHKDGEGRPSEQKPSPVGTKGERSPGATRIASTTASTGGPDIFGYTWDNGVSYSWETTTTNAGIYGDDVVDLVSIGFPFKYYEFTYNEIYVTTNGILVLGSPDSGCCGGIPLPSPAYPNNIIVPFSEDLTVGDGHNNGGIYLKNGGTSPNRFFVVEWRDVTVWGDDWGSTYTFQAILHEGGDIVFQYKTVGNSWWWYTIGIEDSYGWDGLAYPYYLYNGDAIRFNRPDPSARVAINPRYQGTFTSPGEQSTFEMLIRNTGELGTDTYNLTTTAAWTVTLYTQDGSTPLTDTDSNGIIDTGPVPQSGSVRIIAKTNTPTNAALGDYHECLVTGTSHLNPGKSGSATLQAAIPTRFAQSYQDIADDLNHLYLARPDGDRLFEVGSDGDSLAVAESPTNYVYIWNEYDYLVSEDLWVSELFYSIIDATGVYTAQLTDHSAAIYHTYDYDPAVAVTPDGHIGITWYRYRYNENTGSFNYNIHFAILNSSGTVIHGPVNITTIGGWGVYRITDPRITATGDNHFVLAWQLYYYSSGVYYNDVYYAVYESSGSTVRIPTNFSNDGGNTEAYYNPSLAQLSNDRVLLVYQYVHNDIGSNLHYAVLNSSGSVHTAPTSLTTDTWDTWDWVSDAVEFSDGNILISWMDDEYYKVYYAILNPSYSIVHGPTAINNPVSDAEGWMSVSADANGNAVITWQDLFTRQNLYYTLIDSSGGVVTPPTIYASSKAADPHIFSNDEGYGNTTYLYPHPFPWAFDHHVYLPLVIR